MSDELYPNYKDIDEFVTCMFDYAKVTDPFDCDMPQHECAVQSILHASKQDEEIERLTAEVSDFKNQRFETFKAGVTTGIEIFGKGDIEDLFNAAYLKYEAALQTQGENDG